MRDTKGFVAVRKGIKEHLDEGHMTGREWMVYSALLLYADYETGVCYKMSAPFLARFLQERSRTVSRILKSLEAKKYIHRLRPQGGSGYYPVIINRYLTSDCLLIDARNSLSLQHIAYWPQKKEILSDPRRSFECPSDVLRVSSIKEIKKGRKKNINKQLPLFQR